MIRIVSWRIDATGGVGGCCGGPSINIQSRNESVIEELLLQVKQCIINLGQTTVT